MRWAWCIHVILGLLCLNLSQAQESNETQFSAPYPTRSEGPSVQFGQGYQSVAPSMPNPADGKIKVQPRVESAEGGAAKESVVTAEVKALVFVESGEAVKADGVQGASGVITGIKILQQQDFREKLQPYLGKPATMATLNKISRDVIEYYRREGFPVVNVIVPKQTVRDGVIQFVVTEAKVGKVIVEGAKWFNPDKFKDEVSLREGDKVDGDQLQEDVRWLNNNPFRSTDLAFQPGEAPGTTDVILEVNDRMPLRFFFTYDNYGIDITGKNRLSTGFNFGNLFNLDQQVNFQYTTTTQNIFNTMNAYSGSWIVPFPWRNYMTIYGAYSGSSAEVSPNSTLNGSSWQVSARYNAPLPMIFEYTHELYGGFDFKQASNSLLIYNTSIGAGGGFGTYNVFQLTAGYSGNIPDPIGSTSFEVAGFYSPGGVGSLNDTDTYHQVVPNADPDYGYGKLNLKRGFILPMNFSLTGAFNGQITTSNLMPTEQYGLGGYNTVRGYDERVANGDDAWVVNVEFRTPPGSIAKIFDNQEIEDRIQFLAFWDYGYVGFSNPSPGQSSTYLMGVGPGLRYNIDRFVSVQFDWGWQLKQTPPGSKANNRAEISATISY
ncbi:MAG: ShlB/FhaC/HecB family hemolysin secretion/activation protein [Verrucomicrobia bacterium]|nr:ShlB/FhaC/HecB family hemolysin secretion/activation protein [Verrucomicrobiota bacterium]